LKPDQDCQQCGRCCEKWGWDQKGIIDDIIPWMDKNRNDILQYVSITLKDGTRCNGRDISIENLPEVSRIDYWAEPSGRALDHCPFFHRAGDGKVFCKIHDAKPSICRSFTPWNEGIRDYALNCPACRQTTP